MKKLGLLLVGTLLLSGNAFAQKSVVDAVNKEIGGINPILLLLVKKSNRRSPILKQRMTHAHGL